MVKISVQETNQMLIRCNVGNMYNDMIDSISGANTGLNLLEGSPSILETLQGSFYETLEQI